MITGPVVFTCAPHPAAPASIAGRGFALQLVCPGLFVTPASCVGRRRRGAAFSPSGRGRLGSVWRLRRVVAGRASEGAPFAAPRRLPACLVYRVCLRLPGLPPPLAAPPCPPASPLPLAPVRWSARCARSKRGGSPGRGPSGRRAPYRSGPGPPLGPSLPTRPGPERAHDERPPSPGGHSPPLFGGRSPPRPSGCPPLRVGPCRFADVKAESSLCFRLFPASRRLAS